MEPAGGAKRRGAAANNKHNLLKCFSSRALCNRLPAALAFVRPGGLSSAALFCVRGSLAAAELAAPRSNWPAGVA